MQINGSIALVTGANRGLGAAFARGLLDRGAAKVYAAARTPESISDERLTPVRLDVTDRASIAEAAALATDVEVLINNAGILTGSGVLANEEDVRREIEVNYFGPLAVSRSFAPILASNGGGAILNVLSVLSWFVLPTTGGYSAAKAAMWAASNAMRLELKEQGTSVTALHAAFIDTDMAAKVEAPKSTPDEVVAQALDAIEAGDGEVLVDDVSRHVRSALSGPLSGLYPTGN